MESSNLLDKIKYEEELRELSVKSKRNFRLLLLIFISGLVMIGTIIYSFPEVSETEKNKIFQLPNTPDKVREFVKGISHYSETHFYKVFLLFVWIYLL